MYLIDEQHILRLQGGEDAGQVARLIQHGAAGNLEAYAQLISDDVGERRLTQTRRAVQQRMIQRLAAIAGSLHEDLQVLHHLRLSRKILKVQRAQGILEVRGAALPAVCRGDGSSM